MGPREPTCSRRRPDPAERCGASRAGPHGAAGAGDRDGIGVLSLALPGRQLSFGRRSASPRRSAWSGRSATCSASSRSACPIRAPGWITALGDDAPPTYPFLPVEGEACTRSRSVPSTPASSSPAISASPATARPWFGWSSGLATSTRASTRCWPARRSTRAAQLAGRVSGDSTVAYALGFARAVEAALGIAAAAARGVAARRDGGAGADRQPPRRFRRDLQRCLVQHDAGALRRAARAGAARRRSAASGIG